MKSARPHKKLLKILLFLGVFTYFPLSAYTQLDSSDVIYDTTLFQMNGDMYEKVMSMTQAVEDPDRQVGQFDPDNAPSLPIGLAKTIGGVKYIICIDSAYFLPTGAYFSAYMALEFPGGRQKIAFAAKDIKFNPEGIIGGEQSKLMLVSEHFIELGQNTVLRLPDDGSNYVSWTCNGFESVNLKGEFIFNKKILEPADNRNNVIASFETNIQDMQNIMTTVNFSPFSPKGMQDFEFTVIDATVDMSDYQNPPNAPLPSCYQEVYGADLDLWRGFHLKYMEVKLPEKLSAHDDTTEIYAQNLFIDDAGVTGEFGANNVLALHKGDANGWGFSIDNIEVGLTVNELTKGAMAGEIKIPIMDDNSLLYAAIIQKNEQTGKPDYSFSASPSEPMEIGALNSTLTINQNSSFNMSIRQDRFDPSLILNGDWKLNNKNAKFQGIDFQNVTVITQFPYVTNGQFALADTLSAEMAKFTVSLNSIQLGVNNGRVGMQTNLGMSLGDSAISVTSGFEIYANAVTGNDNKPRFEFDKFRINTISILSATAAYHLEGTVNFAENDPTYGDGFKGSIYLSIRKVLGDDNPIAMHCIFGKVNDYKYWAVDVTAPLPKPTLAKGYSDGVRLGNIVLTQVTGGLSYHMDNTRSVESIISAASVPMTATTNVMASEYVPDSSKSVGFSAGVGFRYHPPGIAEQAAERGLNGEVIFQIEFNSNGGLSNVLLAGNAYMMATKQEIITMTAPAYAKGAVAVGYDCEQKIFDMQLTANANFQNVLTGNIWTQLYISPNLWFFHLGKPSARCNVTVVNLASLSAYFMLGQQSEPMPPPPPEVSSVLGGLQPGRDNNAIVNGTGIATGADLYIGFPTSYVPVFNKWHAYASGYVGAGFDLTMIKYATGTHCSGLTEPIGANLWYMQGQLYAYGGMSAGAAKMESDGSISNNFTVISASMAMLLQGKFPNPSYVYGGINLQATVFNIFNLNLTMDFDFGTDCQIVN